MTNTDAIEYAPVVVDVSTTATTTTKTGVLSPAPPPPPADKRRKLQLNEINAYLTCRLCKGYLIDATTISECLHSFCRSCIIQFLRQRSHCPVCEAGVNKARPNLKLDKTLQDIVYKLVPELYRDEMRRRRHFYQRHLSATTRLTPEQRGDDTERLIFNARDKFSLRLEYLSADSTPGAIAHAPSDDDDGAQMRRFLQCPGMCPMYVLKKFVQAKYSVDANKFHIDILYKSVPLPDHYTLIDVAYIYSWKRNEPMRFLFRIIDMASARERFDYFDETPPPAPPAVEKPKQQPSNNNNKKQKKKVVRFQCATKCVEGGGGGGGKVTSPPPPPPPLPVYDKAKTEFFKSIDLHPRHALPTVAPSVKRKLPPATSASSSSKRARTNGGCEQQQPSLKTLLNTCKIPSSLSITCVHAADGEQREPQLRPMVINHIEIVKLPERSSKPTTTTTTTTTTTPDLEKLGTSMKVVGDEVSGGTTTTTTTTEEASISITLEKEKKVQQVVKPGVHPNLPKVLAKPIGVRPITSFQKMFEDTLLRRDRWKEPPPLVVVPSIGEQRPFKRGSIMEIASQLYRKTKLEQERAARSMLRKTTETTVANLRSNAKVKGEENAVTSTTTKLDQLTAPPLPPPPPLNDLKVTSSVTPGSPPALTTIAKPVKPVPPPPPPTTTKLDVNQLQEKYKLQNLAQLSATFNFNRTPPPPSSSATPSTATNTTTTTTSPTLSALQQAMLLNLGIQQQQQQSRENWLSFLQNLAGKTTKSGAQGHLLSKDN